ncbi:MAG: hypothetical protein FWF46_01830 [Oscillospiraceae bacterium]|nr:hypothetical protein [Oscillospiraceae bacterium]
MKLKNDLIEIECKVDDTFSLKSTDNQKYDYIYNLNEITRNDYIKAYSIVIYNGDIITKIAIVGLCLGCNDNCILDGNNLIVVADYSVIIINLIYFKIHKHVRLPSHGTYFSIYTFDDGYIVYGEIDIVKLSKDFTIQWTFSGADIFVTTDGTDPFIIQEKCILLTDWNGKQYKLNNLGKEIK